MIVNYSVGHTGSIHDSWAFQSTQTFKEDECIFAPGKWMWADSAYPSETWSVSPFKNQPMGSLILTRGHSITTYQRYELYNVYHLVTSYSWGVGFHLG